MQVADVFDPTDGRGGIAYLMKRRTPKCLGSAATGAHVSCTAFLPSGVRSGMMI